LAGGRSHEEIVEALLAGGVRLIQVREKYLTETKEGEQVARDTNGKVSPLSHYALCDSIRRSLGLARAAGATLLVNDDPVLAAETGVDGVHVGQDDCPPRRARTLLGPGRIIGLSTHNRNQLRAALDEPIDYVAIGPVFGTTSKASPYETLGLEFVSWAAEESAQRGIPLVAIGGIDLTNLEALLRAAPSCHPAVISALMTEGDIAARAREFLAAMKPLAANGCTDSP